MAPASLGYLGGAKQDTASRSSTAYDELDVINLADEVSDLARREYEAWESDLSGVVQHTPKWDHRADRRSRSWACTIKEHRRRVVRRLTQSPSLMIRRDEALAELYERGRAEALAETDLPDALFPLVTPSQWDAIMNRPIEWSEP